MAKTIQEIQEMITSKYDAREVINEIADYLQSISGGSGGAGTLQQVTDLGNTTTNPIIVSNYIFAQSTIASQDSAGTRAAMLPTGVYQATKDGENFLEIQCNNILGFDAILQAPRTLENTERTIPISITDANGTHYADINGNIDLT